MHINTRTDQYTVRTVPFDMRKALKYNGSFDPIWIKDKGLSFLTLGYSFALENAEFIVSSLARSADKLISDLNIKNCNKLFVQQELQHAKYHRYLNEILNPRPTSREKYHPRVYDFLYSSYKIYREPDLQRIYGASSDEEKISALRESLLQIGQFETQTCIIGMCYFQDFFENGGIEEALFSSINLAILYLYGYHLVEEIEHCCNAFRVYKHIFNEKIWCEENFSNFLDGPEQPIHTDSYAIAFLLAKEAGVNLTIEEVKQNFFSRNYRRKFEEEIFVGFDPNEETFKAKRIHYIKKWDTEWEPMLHKRICSLLSKENY